MRRLSLLAVTLLLSMPVTHAAKLPLERLKLPDGLQISVVARVNNARQMALAERPGILFVGSRRAGTMTALQDNDGDGIYEQQFRIARGLNLPSGITLRGNDLYVAAVDRILRYPGVAQRLDNPPKPQLITDQLPDETHHGWKYLKFGPDGWLYLNVGAPCNICLSEDPRFASLLKLNVETGEQQIVAHGVRNSVGFTFHPVDNSLWFTDNGRDHLGDNRPDDELNRLTRPGLHFGYPFLHGNDVWDPLYGKQGDRTPGAYQLPVAQLGAHHAPLGLTFYTGHSLPGLTRNSLFIAEHGSWNRSSKVGYRVTRIETEEGRVVSQQPFISGWLQGQRHWGRPVDVVVDHDGSLLISDDYAGAIYRVKTTP